MAIGIDWTSALIGAAAGWIASGKVDECQQKFATTVAEGSAAGVKAALKANAKKLAKKAKKGASTGNGKTN